MRATRSRAGIFSIYQPPDNSADLLYALRRTRKREDGKLHFCIIMRFERKRWHNYVLYLNGLDIFE